MTYDEINKYVDEHNAGVKVSNLYISHVKRKYGIKLEKYNLSKMKTVGNCSVRKIKREQLWRHWSILR